MRAQLRAPAAQSACRLGAGLGIGIGARDWVRGAVAAAQSADELCLRLGKCPWLQMGWCALGGGSKWEEATGSGVCNKRWCPPMGRCSTLGVVYRCTHTLGRGRRRQGSSTIAPVSRGMLVPSRGHPFLAFGLCTVAVGRQGPTANLTVQIDPHPT